MKKTVSINLNGLIFNIDEDAFIMLSEYLDELKSYFSKKEEGDEIMHDIESRIAEIFTSKISASKQVINFNDVEEVISTLGRVEEICDDDTTSERGFTDSDRKKNRKFYRDPENRILAGICAGLSEYTGVNLLAIRIIFVVFFFVSAGFMTLVYVLLWLMVPKARTVAERLEMQGKDINISNIESTIKEEYREVKEQFKKMRKSKSFGDNMARTGKVVASSVNILFGIFSKVIGAFFIAFGVFLIIMISFGLFASSSEFFIHDIAGLDVVPLPYILQLFANQTIAWLFIVALSLVCFIPLISLVYSGINIILKLKSKRVLSVSLLILWVTGLALLIALSISLSTHFVSSNDVVTKNMVISDTTNTIYVKTNHNVVDEDIMEHVFINDIRLIKRNNKLKATGAVGVSIHPCTDSVAYVEVQKSSRGENRNQAAKYASLIRYNYSVTDSLIQLDEYFYLPDDFKLRGQSLDISIYLPEGKKIYIDKATMPLIEDTETVGDLSLETIPSGTFLMKKEGIIPVAE